MLSRISRILTATILSLLLISVGGGVAIARCIHSESVSLAYMTDNEAACDEDCCDDCCETQAADCVELSVETLSPFFGADQTGLDFHVFQPVILIFSENIRLLSMHSTPSVWIDSTPPPLILAARQYLSRYCTLLI